MTIKVERRLFSTAEFLRMAEVGILTEDDRVELIDGEIRQMDAIDPPHSAVVTRLNHALLSLIGSRYIVSVQNPLQLSEHTAPQPDVAVLYWHDDFYEQAHPEPSDTLIVIEVSNTTLTYDRNEKLPRYAASGIPEAWIINVPRQQIEVHSQPTEGQYANKVTLQVGATLQSTIIPDLQLAVNRVFGL